MTTMVARALVLLACINSTWSLNYGKFCAIFKENDTARLLNLQDSKNLVSKLATNIDTVQHLCDPKLRAKRNSEETLSEDKLKYGVHSPKYCLTSGMTNVFHLLHDFLHFVQHDQIVVFISESSLKG